MAVKPSDEGKPFVQGIVEILKPSFDDGERHCSLDILPILFDEASLPGSMKYPLDSSHGRDLYSISVMPQESNNLQCASQLAFLRFLEVPDQAKDRLCTDAELNCQNCFDLHIDGPYTDVENDAMQVPESNDKSVDSGKSENVFNRLLRRQTSVNLGAKLIQLLMNSGTMSPREKTGAERIHEVSNNNQWRRYKRAASFDSRKVVLFFSILSIVGTLVLIYLTLRVRQQSGEVVDIHV